MNDPFALAPVRLAPTRMTIPLMRQCPPDTCSLQRGLNRVVDGPALAMDDFSAHRICGLGRTWIMPAQDICPATDLPTNAQGKI